MLIEKAIEANICNAVADLQMTNAAIRGSRQGVPVEDENAAVNIAVAVGMRAHDAFSLPTVDIPGTVAVVTRVDMDPSGVSHENALEELLDLFGGWHENGAAMTSDLSTEDGRFYAAELRLEGGSGKVYDSASGVWTESFNFTIRGNVSNTLAAGTANTPII